MIRERIVTSFTKARLEEATVFELSERVGASVNTTRRALNRGIQAGVFEVSPIKDECRVSKQPRALYGIVGTIGKVKEDRPSVWTRIQEATQWANGSFTVNQIATLIGSNTNTTRRALNRHNVKSVDGLYTV